MLEQVNLILKWSVFPPCLCRLLEIIKQITRKYEQPEKTSGFLCGWTQLHITGSDWEQSWPFPISFSYWRLTLGQWCRSTELRTGRFCHYSTGAMTILRDGYPLWGTLQPGSCAPLAYAERLLENIMAHFKPAFQASSLHWVLSGTKWKRLYVPGPHPTLG